MSAMIIPQALLVYISLEPEHKLTCFSFLFVVYLLYWDLLEHVELKQAPISERSLLLQVFFHTETLHQA